MRVADSRLAPILLLATLGLTTCGSEDASSETEAATETTDPELPDGTSYALSDGTQVLVTDTGALWIVRDGRPVFAMADEARPRLHRYQEDVFAGVGLWTFTRSDDQVFDAAELGAHGQSGDEVTVEYTGAQANITLTVGIHRPGEAARILVTPSDTAFDSLSLPLRCDEEATFFGFGEQYNGTDQRGETFSLFVSEQGIGRDPNLGPLPINGARHTTYFPMPYYYDARGFAGLWQTDRKVEVDLCASDPAAAWFETTEPGQDILVYYGPTGYDVLRQLGDDVGRPPMPPAWAWQLWVAAQGGQEAVETEMQTLQAANIPVKALWVQDWTGIRMNFDGGFGVEYRWETDTELYPDLPGFIDGLHAQGIQFLGYANPFIDVGLQHFEPMDTDDLLIKDASGASYTFIAPNGRSSLPDFTRPEARMYTQGFLRAMVQDIGMDGFMADFGEYAPLDAVYSDGSDPLGAHNRYPVWWHETWRGAMDQARPEGNWAVIVRSGWTGVQGTAQIFWAGDQEADFSIYDGLPTVVPALLNLGLAGVPFVTHDIGGFSGGPSTKELYLRWVELGAFTPIMRTHEGANKLENWSWERDTETTDHFRRFARIHEALGPELMSWAGEAVQSSKPLVRHLMLEFPDDPQSRSVSDQYMLGDVYLVAPVVTEGQTSRTVYLPPGTWFHLWTGQSYEGGQSIEVDAPIGSPPVFTLGVDRPELRAIDG
jgi:alpha-glucosidase